MIREINHFDRFGTFLDGSQWTDQPVKFLARMEVARKVLYLRRALDTGKFDNLTEGEAHIIEWLQG